MLCRCTSARAPGPPRSAVWSWCWSTACSPPAAGPPGPAPAPPPVPAPRLDRFYAQQLSWGPCAAFADSTEDRIAYADSGVRVRAPAGPAGLRRTGRPGGADRGAAPAGHRRSAIGSLVMNPGGPGASGMDLVPALAARLADSPLSRALRPGRVRPARGRGQHSEDQLPGRRGLAGRAGRHRRRPVTGRRRGRPRRRTSELRPALRGAVRGCRGAGPPRHPGRGARPGHPARGAGRREADLPRLLLRHPDRHRPTPRRSRSGSGRWCWTARWTRARAASSRTSSRPSASSGPSTRSPPTARHAEAARSGTDPARATAAFQALVRPLIDRPAQAAERRTLSYPDAIAGVNQALYAAALLAGAGPGHRRRWPPGDGTILLALADEYYQRAPDGHYGDLIEAFIAISCVDEQRITDRAVQAELARRVERGRPVPGQRPGRGRRARRRARSGRCRRPAQPHAAAGATGCRRRW